MAENDVATPSQIYNEYEVKRRLPRTLMGGTTAMREARTEYLPQESGEEEKPYENRLARTFLYNGFRRTVSSHTGQVFDRPVVVEGPERLVEEWVPNITNEGRSLTAFMKDVFETALAEGFSIIHVEYPRAPDGLTAADVRDLDLRPYLVEIPPEALIGWDWEFIFGKPVIVEARIKEHYFEYNGKQKEQIRVLRPGEWELWRQSESDKSWKLFDSGNTEPIHVVPLVPVYTGKKYGPFMAEPPLTDLADQNLMHWQSGSDQRHVLHVARVPVLFGTGLGDEVTKLTVGPNRMIKATNPQATLQFIEHTGKAIDAGRTDLLDIEHRMSRMSLEMLIVDRSGDVTATERAIERAENESGLQSMARHTEDAVKAALALMLEWGGMSDAGLTVDVNRNFEIKITDASELSELRELRRGGDLSQTTLWAEFKRRAVLSDEFDAEKEMVLLGQEGPPGGSFGDE